MASGLYSITNSANGHRYVGSAVNLERRWTLHRFDLRRGTHHSRHLQSAWGKYGQSAFVFEVLEECEPEFLISMEQWWMNMLRPEYNICPTAGSGLGRKDSAEARAKKSAVHTGIVPGPETRAKLSAASTGRKHAAETRAKLSAASMGNKSAIGCKRSEEQREKIGLASMGRKDSDETRARKSAAQTGRKHAPLTPEQSARVSGAMMGNKRHLGCKHSDDTKAKIGASVKISLAKRKDVV